MSNIEELFKFGGLDTPIKPFNSTDSTDVNKVRTVSCSDAQCVNMDAINDDTDYISGIVNTVVFLLENVDGFGVLEAVKLLSECFPEIYREFDLDSNEELVSLISGAPSANRHISVESTFKLYMQMCRHEISESMYLLCRGIHSMKSVQLFMSKSNVDVSSIDMNHLREWIHTYDFNWMM